ncbi:MAG: CDP-alcohol phosphatidyltransferase family protein [Singulisphaera sp.]
MTDRPTLLELRGRVHKDRHREIGNWLARRVARPSAVYGTWVAVRLGASAHQVTLLALLAGGGSALALAMGTRQGFVAGVALAHLAFWLDHVDGQVARWRGTSSLDGVYFDYLMHHAASLSLGFALGYGLAARTGDVRWAASGFLIALGWAFLSLHNDCRYKAFFQRLKRETGSLRVDGGGGGRPSPPSPWPRRGRAALTWPLYKACEPHVVLTALTLLAMLAVVAPSAWLTLAAGSRDGRPCPAPGLGAGGAGGQGSCGGGQFDRWFRPDTPGGPAGHHGCLFAKPEPSPASGTLSRGRGEMAPWTDDRRRVG